jgi:hypothetical protein
MLRLSRSTAAPLLGSALLAALSACGAEPAPDAASPAGAALAEGPPPGRYVCRQHMTTFGYLMIREPGSYEVSGVRGGYEYDPRTGAMDWKGGSYDEWGWSGVYEHVVRPEGDGRPDEHMVRLASEADGLKIDCVRMEEG